MNIKKFLNKLAQIADFQQAPPVTDIPEAPIGQPQEAQQGIIDQTGPLAPNTQAPNIIKADIGEYKPFRGPRKGKLIFFLNLYNITDNMKEMLESLGYTFKVQKRNWSKEIQESNILTIDNELTNIEQTFNVPIDRGNVLEKLRQIKTEIFNIPEDITTELGSGASGALDDIKKIKYTDEKEQYGIAEEVVKTQLEEMVNNLDSEGTRAFLKEYLSVKKQTTGEVHDYSFLNKMIITLQNHDIDPETGQLVPRSGFIAPASIWKDKFGRTIKEDENGMEIFIKKGGKKNISPKGLSVITGVIKKYGNKGLTSEKDIKYFFGYLKKLVASKSLYQTNYNYISFLFNRNKDKFLTTYDLASYIENMAKQGQQGEYYDTGSPYIIKPVIYDIDQTEIIPGQEHLDPKPKIEAIRGMWLGMKNEPDKIVDTLFDALANAATNGLLISGKNINITTKNTGSAGGWSSGGEIAIQKGSAGERRFRTLVHEATHEILHWGEDRSSYNTEQKEIEADATAYIILNHYGVGTGAESLNYISMITKDKQTVMDRLKPVLEASNIIISAIERQKGLEYDKTNPKQARTNWYKKFKFAHYSEPEQKGEGRGGTGQFGERRLGDWEEDHKMQVKKMKSLIKSKNWTAFEIYRQQLMDYYNPPHNKKIVDGIVSAAMSGQRL